MKVFYCSLDSANNYALPESNIWGNNLYKSLMKLCKAILPNFNVSKQYAECFARIKPSRTHKEAKNIIVIYFSKILKKEKKEIWLYYNAFPKKSVVLANY